ncbi:MAG: aspartate carbamoyltransferase catalytic subunit [Akkermansiaceae bacterium]|nr:aspartate carbamoyltransferase catalytic subunit [Akkermansiaceae bacterium]
MAVHEFSPVFSKRHLLGIEGLSPLEIQLLLDRADEFVDHGRQANKKLDRMRGLTQINLFYESSTRTRTSFELAGKRLGADVVNMSISSSSIKKGETLIDTAMTLNAMHPDVLVARHHDSGAIALLARHVNCAVINAGDGSHEHPTQALLDLYTIRERGLSFEGLRVAIVGDVAHSRVARSNIHALSKLGAEVRVVGPPTMMPTGIDKLGARVYYDLDEALRGVHVIMMLRLIHSLWSFHTLSTSSCTKHAVADGKQSSVACGQRGIHSFHDSRISCYQKLSLTVEIASTAVVRTRSVKCMNMCGNELLCGSRKGVPDSRGMRRSRSQPGTSRCRRSCH